MHLMHAEMNLREICARSARDLRRSARDLREICPRSARDPPEIRARYARDRAPCVELDRPAFNLRAAHRELGAVRAVQVAWHALRLDKGLVLCGAPL